MMSLTLIMLQALISHSSANSSVPVTDVNAAGIAPGYNHIDNRDEKAVSYSWGKLYYTSMTADTDHAHADKANVTLKLRYECKNSRKEATVTVHKYQFCGYAKSEVDENQKKQIIKELSQQPEHRKKPAAELEKIYNSEYNDRIVDPAWSISEKTVGGKRSIEVLVRENASDMGTCEDKVTPLNLPIQCD